MTENKAAKYEYLDHTADVQLHSWGTSLEEAIENCVVAMYGYMTTDLCTVERLYSMDFEAEGNDLCALVYNLLDACLYRFVTEPFFIGTKCERLAEEDAEKFAVAEDEEGFEEFKKMESKPPFKICLRSWGESFDKEKHPPGTEVKAITYSNLQVVEPQDTTTDKANEALKKKAEELEIEDALKNGDVFYEKHNDEFNVFVIVDI